jgi:hypothetical protein
MSGSEIIAFLSFNFWRLTFLLCCEPAINTEMIAGRSTRSTCLKTSRGVWGWALESPMGSYVLAEIIRRCRV